MKKVRCELAANPRDRWLPDADVEAAIAGAAAGAIFFTQGKFAVRARVCTSQRANNGTDTAGREARARIASQGEAHEVGPGLDTTERSVFGLVRFSANAVSRLSQGWR